MIIDINRDKRVLTSPHESNHIAKMNWVKIKRHIIIKYDYSLSNYNYRTLPPPFISQSKNLNCWTDPKSNSFPSDHYNIEKYFKILLISFAIIS